MALSSTTYSDGILPARILATDTPCVGEFIDLEQMDLQTDIANGFRDTLIELNIGYSNIGTSGVTEITGVGLRTFLTNTNGTYTLVKSPDNESNYYHLFTVTINKISNTSITIDANVFIAHDTDGQPNLSTSYSPSRHMHYASIRDNAPFLPTSTSVFNAERDLIVSVNTDNDESFSFRKRMRARFYNRDIDGAPDQSIAGSVVEVPDTVPETGNIEVKASFTTALTLESEYIVGFFRTSNPISGTNLVQVQELEMTSSVSGQVNPNVPNGSFLITGPIVNEGGGLFSISIEIDRNAVSSGVEYSIFFILRESGTTASFAIASIAGQIDTTFPPTAGNIEVLFATHDKVGKLWETDCISGLAINERVNMSVTMNKESYNDDIITNGVTGTFDSNFKGALFAITDILPATTTELLSVSDSIQSTNIIDNGQSLTLVGSTRILNEWEGISGFALFTFVFEINIPSLGKYTDYVTVPVRLLIGYKDDHPAGDQILALESVKNADGDTVNPTLCLSSEERLIFTFTNSAANPEEYLFIPYLRLEGTNSVLEFNEWKNPYLRQLESELFIQADEDFTGGTASVEIDPQLVPLDQTYCVGAIAKRAVPDDPPLTSQCPTFDITVSHSADNVSLFSFTYGFGVQLSNFSDPSIYVSVFNVVAVWQQTNQNMGSISVGGNLQFVQYSDNINFIPLPNTIEVRYYIDVVTVDSQKRTCEYRVDTSLILSINTGLAYSTDKTINVTPS